MSTSQIDFTVVVGYGCWNDDTFQVPEFHETPKVWSRHATAEEAMKERERLESDILPKLLGEDHETSSMVVALPHVEPQTAEQPPVERATTKKAGRGKLPNVRYCVQWGCYNKWADEKTLPEEFDGLKEVGRFDELQDAIDQARLLNDVKGWIGHEDFLAMVVVDFEGWGSDKEKEPIAEEGQAAAQASATAE